MEDKDFDDRNIIKKYWREVRTQGGYKEKLRNYQKKEKEYQKRGETQKKKRIAPPLVAKLLRLIEDIAEHEDDGKGKDLPQD